MTNFRPAPDSFVEQLKRRLEKTMPAAKLERDSVKLHAIPGTDFDATVFKYRDRKKNKRVLVAELARPDLPHIYQAFALTDSTVINAARMVAAILSLTKRIREDRRFARKTVFIR